MKRSIEVHKYQTEREYTINEYPEWDTDTIHGKDDYTVYGDSVDVYVAAVPGDPPIIGIGETVGDAVDDLEFDKLFRSVVVVDHTIE